MKLNYKSILTAAALTIAGTNANAGMLYDIYAGGTVGIGSTIMMIDNNGHHHNGDHMAQSYGAVFGIDLPVVRFEAEYDLLDSKRLDMQTLTGNAYVKLPGLVVVSPYIGVGVGVMLDANNNYNNIKLDSAMAYQGMLGATLDIPAIPFKIDIEGRTIFVPELYSKDSIEIDAIHYDARIKLRYIF